MEMIEAVSDRTLDDVTVARIAARGGWLRQSVERTAIDLGIWSPYTSTVSESAIPQPLRHLHEVNAGRPLQHHESVAEVVERIPYPATFNLV